MNDNDEVTYFEIPDFKDLLKTIIQSYKISPVSLSKVSGLDKDLISDISNGKINIDSIPYTDRAPFDDLVTMLTIGMEMVENDNRITSIIEALNHEYFISYESIALYAKLEQEDLQQFMNDSSSVTFEKRYKLAVTTLFLHSLFKQPQ